MFGKGKKANPDFQQAAHTANLDIKIARDPHSENVILRNVSLKRPDDGSTMINKFSLTVNKGDRIVLTGPRGCGKSSLLRAIAGLWDHGEGQIVLPANSSILLVPQRPYLPNVPLRGILSYPHEAGKYTDDEMADALRSVGLERLVPVLKDEEHTGSYWASRFSPGEQQALIFARVFLHKPDVLMLDEVTASLDEKSATALYQKLLEKMPDVTLISIVHHKEIIAFHDLHASIDKDRNLTVKPIVKGETPSAGPDQAPGASPS